MSPFQLVLQHAIVSNACNWLLQLIFLGFLSDGTITDLYDASNNATATLPPLTIIALRVHILVVAVLRAHRTHFRSLVSLAVRMSKTSVPWAVRSALITCC